MEGGSENLQNFKILLLFFCDWSFYRLWNLEPVESNQIFDATMQVDVSSTKQDISVTEECIKHIDEVWSNCVLYNPTAYASDTCNAHSKLLPVFTQHNQKSEMALKAFNTVASSADVQCVQDDGLKASRTSLTHDSRNSSIPHFFINPTAWTSVPAEIINQRVIVKNIVEKTDALRNHKFKVTLSYKQMFPMNVLDTIETAREITEVTYSGAWSDIIDAECQNSPIKPLMNRQLMLKNLEASRKQHLGHVEREIWELFKLTMDLKDDTRTLIGMCSDAEILQRSMMNPCMRHVPTAPRPKKHTQHPAALVQNRITFST
jgi:hypothetical protein